MARTLQGSNQACECSYPSLKRSLVDDVVCLFHRGLLLRPFHVAPVINVSLVYRFSAFGDGGERRGRGGCAGAVPCPGRIHRASQHKHAAQPLLLAGGVALAAREDAQARETSKGHLLVTDEPEVHLRIR